MQQNSKGLVVLSFVLVIICTALALLVISLIGLSNTNQPIPISYPDPSVNTIRIVPKSLEKYIYATISAEDTIVLKDISNEKRAINLEHKKWKDIKWNPDYTLISVFGESQEGKYNLYIYNLATERWDQVTSYSDYAVDQYFWYNNDQINFVQGATDQRWLHSYKYSTRSQILKLNLVRGDLVRTNEDKKIMVFKDGSEFILRDAKGALIMPVSEAKLNFTVIDVIVLSDISQIVLEDEDNQLHIYDIIKETLVDFDTLSSNPTLMCAQDLNFKFFNQNAGIVSILTADAINLSVLREDQTFKSGSENIVLKRCNSSFFLISSKGESSKWFNNNSEFAEIVTLDGDLDADVKIVK